MSGDAAIATTHANRALRLSPFDPLAYSAHFTLGIVAFREARYDEAASYFAKAVQDRSGPMFHRWQAVALALAGRVEEARPIVRRALGQPGWQTRFFAEFGIAQAIVDKYAEGARLLELPE